MNEGLERLLVITAIVALGAVALLFFVLALAVLTGDLL